MAPQPYLAAGISIEWPSLIAQTVIFLLVLWVLKKYAFGPVNTILENRRRRIEEAEANFEKARAEVANAQAKSESIVVQANEHAGRLIKEAQDAAAAAGEKKRQEAIAETAAIVAKGREAARLEQEKALTELKRDFGRLVVEATAKVTGKVLTPADHEKITQETTAHLSS